MNIYEFIEFTKQNKDRFINYCEVLIDPKGNIIICKPSHTATAVQYAAEFDNKTILHIKNEIPFTCSALEWCIDKYGLVAVWYFGFMYSDYKNGPNRFQKRTINLLIRNDLIDADYKSWPTHEYKLYLYRKSIGFEE